MRLLCYQKLFFLNPPDIAGPTEPYCWIEGGWKLTLQSSKSTFSQLFKEKCINKVVRSGSIIVSGELQAGEIWNWSLFGMKGLQLPEGLPWKLWFHSWRLFPSCSPGRPLSYQYQYRWWSRCCHPCWGSILSSSLCKSPTDCCQWVQGTWSCPRPTRKSRSSKLKCQTAHPFTRDRKNPDSSGTRSTRKCTGMQWEVTCPHTNIHPKVGGGGVCRT